MKKIDLTKYPRNILIPVVLFLIGILIVVVIYNVNSTDNSVRPDVKPQKKMSINTKADFNVDSSIIVGDKKEKNDNIPLSGNSKLDIDLSNGEIILQELKLKSKPAKLNNYAMHIKNLKVSLNSSYPSIGKVTLDTGAIDISLDLLISYDYKSYESRSYKRNLNMTIPLSGHIDRDSGTIKLKGEATIPPDKHSIPLPIAIQVIATSKQNEGNKNS